ncbi:uncharacterized protein LOC143181957 [Calliopsis andreniformis]|uniref:uncharacterized protein LOC143181957 n=1 Tax=Calliopsis andreniformis TaxID=337506 RepID=UPI003FCC6CE7
MVPCAQGRVIVETARPVLPYFATCTSYRRQTPISSASSEVATVSGTTSSSAILTDQQSSKGAISKNVMLSTHSTAARPEDLGVTPWYLEDQFLAGPLPSAGPGGSSYPSSSHPPDAEVISRPDIMSTKNSSVESATPRKAYMDLRDAIALLDETCPNKEPSQSLTPRTPRTPLTPHPRNKRARSKSSDNSSNFSSDRLSDKSVENARPQDKDKKRPFLKKIGISKTEDKPFLAKIAPKIIGKPYLEKIGPSKAVERPFLEKIGSSKTLDKFIFDIPRYEKKAAEKSKNEALKEGRKSPEIKEETKNKTQKTVVTDNRFGADRRRSGKGTLLKMYSFETEDLESTVQPKDNRDPFRGTSLDDVLDSGPSSLPLDISEEASKEAPKEQAANGAELLKCRVTTSEEIICFNTSFGSDKEPNSWSSSPKKRWFLRKDLTTPRTPSQRRILQSSNEGRSDDSVPNSPTKRPISDVSTDHPEESRSDGKNVYSPLKTRRQTYEDILERNGKEEEEGGKPSRQAQFEKRGISSDNLLSKDRSFAVYGYQGKDQVEKTREAVSEDYLAYGSPEYSKETFKQLQDKFKSHEIPMETYADFKRRTRGNMQSIIARQERFKTNTMADAGDAGSKTKAEASTKLEAEGTREGGPVERNNEEKGEPRGGTVRSVLKKQQGIDHASDQEFDSNASLRRPKRRIFQEPSQETMDLLTELRKVKSLLKAPSWEKDLELDKKPARQPKRILLTDKEFCLSVERENSIRRPSRVMNSLEKTEEGVSHEKEEKEEERRTPGPALFEKKCLSLDYADEEKPQKPEARAISLASARNIPSEDLALICDSKSYSSDVFNSPSEEIDEKECSSERDIPRKMNQNHCAEVDIAIPIDQRVSSPKGRVQVLGRTNDLYEIISPRSTPFRVKKRLGKISVEDAVKPESFTLGSKVDCRSTVVQKRTKCFPL